MKKPTGGFGAVKGRPAKGGGFKPQPKGPIMPPTKRLNPVIGKEPKIGGNTPAPRRSGPAKG